jgi:hypothetical protein
MKRWSPFCLPAMGIVPSRLATAGFLALGLMQPSHIRFPTHLTYKHFTDTCLLGDLVVGLIMSDIIRSLLARCLAKFWIVNPTRWIRWRGWWLYWRGIIDVHHGSTLRMFEGSPR